MRHLVFLAAVLATSALATEGVPEQTIITSDSVATSARLTLGWKYIQCTTTTRVRLEGTQAAAELEDGSGLRIQAYALWPLKVTVNTRWVGLLSSSGVGGCRIYATDNPNPTAFVPSVQSATITLDGAGAGTATVASGSNCVCSGAATLLPTGCSVSGSTLTVQGNAGDTASYICAT